MLLSLTQCFMANCVAHWILSYSASATWCYSVRISELHYSLVAQNYVRRGTFLPLKIKTASSGNLRSFACWWKDAVQAAWVWSVPCLGNPSCCSALCLLLAVFPSAALVGGCMGIEIKHWAGRAQLSASVTVSPSLNQPWTSTQIPHRCLHCPPERQPLPLCRCGSCHQSKLHWCLIYTECKCEGDAQPTGFPAPKSSFLLCCSDLPWGSQAPELMVIVLDLEIVVLIFKDFS